MTSQKFRKIVLEFYRTQGRQGLPWRHTRDPYRILVSEIMLQQTQVERVVPKYEEFLKRFPSVGALSAAPLRDVLVLWQGLGYNRRAKLLHKCAKEITDTHGGKFPSLYEALRMLPGVGPYTAGAVMAFAYNAPVPLIETNIRTVYLHHFFKGKNDVSEKELLKRIETTLDAENPREWYAALMDYGAVLKKEVGNQNARSRSYKKQSAFLGSDRQIRGGIIRELSKRRHTTKSLVTVIGMEEQRVREQLCALMGEGLVDKRGTWYSLPI